MLAHLAASVARASMADIQQQLATLLGKEAADIVNIRRNGSLYSLIDIAMMVTGKPRDYAGHRVDEVGIELMK